MNYRINHKKKQEILGSLSIDAGVCESLKPFVYDGLIDFERGCVLCDQKLIKGDRFLSVFFFEDGEKHIGKAHTYCIGKCFASLRYLFT